MTGALVREALGERADALGGGLRVIQRADAFRFGTDSVLLADFAAERAAARVCELCGGSGVVSMLIASRRERCEIDCVELLPDIADMAKRSVALNGMESRIRVHAMDLRDAPAALGHGAYSLVVCNPPYGKLGAALTGENPGLRAARHEGECDIEDVARAASALLRVGGRFAAVFPAQRVLELAQALRARGLEPKRVRTVHSFANRAPKRVLMDAVKGGGSQLHWLEPLVLYDAGGAPSPELRRIYREDT